MKHHNKSYQRRGNDNHKIFFTPKTYKVLLKRTSTYNNVVRCKVDPERCICNYCGDSIKCTTVTGTNGLNKYKDTCKVCHNFLAGENRKQKVITSDGKKSASFVAWSFVHYMCRQMKVMILILDKLPFSFVDGIGFIQLVSELCPNYIIPSRNTITRDI